MSLKKHTIEKIAAYVLGYRGYKDEEVRRETDALLRRHIASILSSAAAQLVLSPTDARAVAANPDARFLWDSVRAALDRVTQKIDKAPHGYSGFFDLVKVDEAALEQVYRHDLALVEATKKVAALSGTSIGTAFLALLLALIIMALLSAAAWHTPTPPSLPRHLMF